MTTSWSRRVLPVVAALMLAAGLGACGGKAVAGTSGKEIKQLPPDFVGSELLGLPIAQEDMTATVARADDAFVESIGLYSMRRDDLLQATLQVSKFRSNAPIEKASFRSSVVRQIGGRTIETFRMGSTTVYRTTGRKQTISLWFRGRYLFVLSVRESFTQPRTLLRAALEVKPA